MDARNIAIKYDDKVIFLMSIGFGMGLLLRTYGHNFAIMADIK